MDAEKRDELNLTTGTDLAFALVVFISFFTIFSSAPITNPFSILLIIFLGIAYISFGIYGFAYAQRSLSNRTKIGYFIVQLFLGGCIVFLGKGAGINSLVLLPLVAHSAMLLEPDRVLVVNIGIILGYIVSVYSYSGDVMEVWKGLPFFFTGQVVILIFTQMAVTELKARVRLESLAGELSEANKHLKDYAERVKELTITQERNRMAREIHDGLGHYLTILNMQLKAAAAMITKDTSKSEKMVNNAIQLTSDALIDVRNSVFALRQEKGEITPLEERIKGFIDSIPKETMVNFKCIGSFNKISPQVDLTIYRAAQEMVNNVIKHSEAKEIEIILDSTDDSIIRLSCSDDGKGSESYKNGFGIIGLEERVKLLRGDLSIESSKGNGFKISIRIPKDHDD
jgi:signal transduction histidine kinase